MYKRPKFLIKKECVFPISFHDTDAMQVVWHGNYIKFFELAREAMFEEFGYSYEQMKQDKLIFPITEVSCKYRRSLTITDKALKVIAMLTDFDAKLVVFYEVYKVGDDKHLCAYGKTEQVAMTSDTLELQFQTPKALLEAIDRHAKANS